MCNTDLDTCPVWNETRVHARKPHCCYECNRTIPVGVDYIRIGALYDASWTTYHLHVECREMWRFIIWEVCGGEGTVMVGGLREEIVDHDLHKPARDIYGDDDDPPTGLSVSDIYEAFIEHHPRLQR